MFLRHSALILAFCFFTHTEAHACTRLIYAESVANGEFEEPTKVHEIINEAFKKSQVTHNGNSQLLWRVIPGDFLRVAQMSPENGPIVEVRKSPGDVSVFFYHLPPIDTLIPANTLFGKELGRAVELGNRGSLGLVFRMKQLLYRHQREAVVRAFAHLIASARDF